MPASLAPTPTGWVRRQPERSVLHNAVRRHAATFAAWVEERGGRDLPGYVRLDRGCPRETTWPRPTGQTRYGGTSEGAVWYRGGASMGSIRVGGGSAAPVEVQIAYAPATGPRYARIAMTWQPPSPLRLIR